MKLSTFAGCPCCYILPSDIAEAIARNGDEKAKNNAFNTLDINSKIRQHRAMQALNLVAPSSIKTGDRQIYSAGNRTILPGKLTRKEGSTTVTNPDVNNTYENIGIVRQFLKDVLNFVSFDNAGSDILASVDYARNYSNAFWDGKQLVFGDGDGGKYFNSFSQPLTVAAHEFFHGVVVYTANLDYQGLPGSLNEHFCDVFACMVEQWHLQQKVEDADWVIGRGLFTSAVKGVGVRKLDAPGGAYNDPVLGKDPTIGHYDKRYTGDRNNGGVHYNSGIPNLAFTIAAKAIGGYSWEKLGLVWWITLTQKLKPISNFKEAAIATVEVAADRFRDEPIIAQAIERAWASVGIYLEEDMPGTSKPKNPKFEINPKTDLNVELYPDGINIKMTNSIPKEFVNALLDWAIVRNLNFNYYQSTLWIGGLNGNYDLALIDKAIIEAANAFNITIRSHTFELSDLTPNQIQARNLLKQTPFLLF